MSAYIRYPTIFDDLPDIRSGRILIGIRSDNSSSIYWQTRPARGGAKYPGPGTLQGALQSRVARRDVSFR